MERWLWQFDASVMSLVLAALMAMAWLIGWLLGRERRGRLGDNLSDDESIPEACVALLGLLLAFSFATAYAKYESRRGHVIDEANSIGTFAIRAEFLPEPSAQNVRSLIEQYIRLHLHVAAAGTSTVQRQEMDRQMRQLQNQIVRQTTAGLREGGGVPATQVILMSLNDMLDQYEMRVAGVVDHVPTTVLGMLAVVSVISSLLMGRRQGEKLQMRPWTTLVFLILVACVVYVTLDLDQPWHGLSRASQISIERLADSMGVKP